MTDLQEELGQVIANSFFGMEAGYLPTEPFELPVPSSGDLQIAFDILDSPIIRRIQADFLKEIIREVRDIPCWYPDGDPMGGEFDLDGESHRRFVLDTLLAYGSKLF